MLNEGIADIKRLSEELRLGYVNGKFKWLVGFYGDKNERNMYLYGKNIFDKRYDYEGAYGGVVDLLKDPGQIGLQVNYRF